MLCLTRTPPPHILSFSLPLSHPSISSLPSNFTFSHSRISFSFADDLSLVSPAAPSTGAASRIKARRRRSSTVGASDGRDTLNDPLSSVLRVGDTVLIDHRDRGTLRYLAPVKGAQGVMAGVELEQPYGDHNGTVDVSLI